MRVFACVALLAVNQPLFAEKTITLMECGGSKGWAYYLPGGLVPKDDAGWKKDGISKGKIRLVYNGKDYDIIFVDVTGKEKSAIEEGATVIRLEGTDEDVTLVVAIYPGF